MENAPEVLHHSAKCGAVIQLNRICKHQHATGLQHAPSLIEHLLAGLARELMEQEHAGHRLHHPVGKRKVLAIALDQLR